MIIRSMRKSHLFGFIISMLAGLLLAGCGGTGLFGPTAVPTIPPTATPVPTPTPLPAELIEQGQVELLNGSWEGAISVFEGVTLIPSLTESEQIAAQVGKANAYLRQGDFVTARAALDSILSAYPSLPAAARAYFLRGDALTALGAYSEAITDYQAYLALKPGLIDSYVYERIGDAYLNLGSYDQAIAAFQSAAGASRPLVDHLRLREKIALIARGYADVATAVDQYQQILELAQNDGYRAQIELYIGQAYYEVGDETSAYAQWEQVFLSYPATYEALSALRALREKDIPVDQYQRGLVNYYNGQYDVAIEAFYDYLSGTPVLSYLPDTFLYTGRSYWQLGNLQSAATEFRSALDFFDPSDGEVWGDLYLDLAEVTAGLGDTAAAIALYDDFIANHPDLPQHPDAMAAKAEMARASADFTTAAALFQQLNTAYPADPRPSAALFDMGYSLFRSGDLVGAESLFRGGAEMSGNEFPAMSWLWLGRTLAAQGRIDEASAAFQSAIAADPGSYAAIRAEENAAGKQPFQPPTSVTFPSDMNEGRDAAETWLVETFALPYTPPFAGALRSDIAEDSRMIRGRELWELGLVESAKQDFEAVRSDFSEDALASYQLAVFFREIGLYRSSILAARAVRQAADLRVEEMPIFIARLEYPVYYRDLVEPECQKYGLDPLFVYALIRQESLFEGFATSSASAQGVMQIWPPTGEDIAAGMA